MQREPGQSGSKTHRPDAKGAGSRSRRALRGLLIALLLVVGAVVGFEIWRWVVVPANAPVVGVSLDTTWYRRFGITSRTYEAALTRVGVRMLGVRPGDLSADQILDRIDALLLSGGGDVDPQLYGGTQGTSERVDRRHDEFELALIRGALDRDMPILAICRGIQILNVAHGGTSRDLRGQPGLSDVHGIDLDSFSAHSVRIAPGTLLARLVGEGEKRVNSFHGQAVGRVGEGLTVAAESPDGVVEALERSDRSFVLAVQWHPEILSLGDPDDLAVFEGLARQAEDYRAGKRSVR